MEKMLEQPQVYMQAKDNRRKTAFYTPLCGGLSFIKQTAAIKSQLTKYRSRGILHPLTGLAQFMKEDNDGTSSVC